MPIRRELLPFYRTPAYKAARARIMQRAHNRCEQCGAPNKTLVERGPDGMWRPNSITPCGRPWRNHSGNPTTFEPVPKLRRYTKIVCTVAHLNHTPGDDRDENLKFLCQWCHLNYDKLHHKQTRSERKDRSRPLLREANS